jgi:TatD DNase family protein
MLIDTHAHLDFPDFAEDLDDVLDRASAAGVKRFITVGTSVESSRRAVALAERYPQVFAVVGVHPNSAAEASDNFIAELRTLAKSPRVVAIGETGLDYHRLPGAAMRGGAFNNDALRSVGFVSTELPGESQADFFDAQHKVRQAEVFERQLELAAELGLNVVIHERDAWDDTLALLRPYSGRLRAVFHCFGKSPKHADEVLTLGHFLSFTGIVTFKNAADAQATATAIPSDRFMVETDCPFLAPVPFRGKRCEPAYTRQVAEWIAQLRGESLADVSAKTTANAEAFFRFSAKCLRTHSGKRSRRRL